MSILAGTQYDEQLQLEHDAIRAGRDRYSKNIADAIRRGDGCDLPVSRQFTDAWMGTVTAAMQQLIDYYRNGGGGRCATLCLPIFTVCRADQLATIFLRTLFSQLLKCETRSRSGRPSVRIDHLFDLLGKSIVADVLHEKFGDSWKEDQLALRRAKEANGEDWDWMADDNFAHLKILLTNRKLPWPKRILQCVKKLELAPDDVNLAPRTYIAVGAAAFNAAMPVLVVETKDGFKQAFKENTTMPMPGGKRRRVLEITPEANAVLDAAHARRATLRPVYEPMVIPPFSWIEARTPGASVIQGGYIKIRTPLVAKPHGVHKKMLAKADLTNVFAGLDACASQPWRVNERILRIQQEAMEKGLAIGDLPSTYPPHNPVRPDDADTNAAVNRAWKKQRVEYEKAKIAHLGQVQQLVSTHELAQKFAGRDFYFPHMMDFRGRTFPIPQFLNHHGDDVRRSLLLMSHPRTLTDSGRWWLMVHAANMYGKDDLPLAQRAQWAMDNADMMVRAVRFGLADEGWQQAEKPFQFLAACMGLMDDEIGAMVPVQRDGTMNGLQHYAAMSGDAEAAAAANLRPSETMRKVYNDVLRYVREKLATEYAGGDYVEDVLPFVVKSVVKQPVMTEMYGVTQYGARKQVYTNLMKEGCPKNVASKTRSLIARIIATADIPYLQSAREIMHWLNDCARHIVDTGNPVSWVTPLGFPVVQPYSKALSQVHTVAGKFNFVDNTRIVPKPKQYTAVAPNVIHSFDACHFLMSATECSKAGLSFAGVFDSFWSQPSDTEEMGRIVLESFCGFHKELPLRELEHQWKMAYGNIPDAPVRGNWDVNEVLESQFAFS